MKSYFRVYFIICLFILTGVSQAYSQQRSVTQTGAYSYVAGPTSMEIDLQGAEKACLNWSWAACLQAVIKFYGLEIKQEQIVKKIFKSLPCNEPNSFQVMNGIMGWAPDSGKKFSTVYAQGGVWTNDKIIEALTQRYPLIITLQTAPGKRQAYVLISVYYTEDGGMKVPEKLLIMEPVADAQPFIVMPWDKYATSKPEVFKFWITKKAITRKK